MIELINPKTGKAEKAVPESNLLRMCIDKKAGKIIDVGDYTFKVNWEEIGISTLRYCNNCGSALFRTGKVKLKNGTMKKAKICFCGAWLGFFEEYKGE